MKMSNITHMLLTTPSSSPLMLSLSPSPSTPTLPTPSRLRIHTPLTLNTRNTPSTPSTPSTHSTPSTPSTHSTCSTHSTRKPPNSIHIHSSHSPSTPTRSTLSTPNHLRSTNSTRAPHSPSTPTNSTHSILRSTHMDTPLRSTLTLTPTLSTRTAPPSKAHTPNIRIHSTLSTHTTPSIYVTRRPTIAEARPEDPHMLVTAPPQTRMTRRASGHNPCCDNQSSKVVLRDDSVTTGGAQPCHDVETLPDKTFITSTQSVLSNGTFVFLFVFFRGRGGGTQVCRSRMETDSCAGDVGPSLCENSTTFTHDYSHTAQVEGKRQILMLTERQMFCVSDCGSDRHVINMAAPPHQRSHRGHLTCPSPAKQSARSGRRHRLDPPSRRSSSASPVFCTSCLFLFKTMVVLLTVSPA